eukprot:10447870-Lingulodinium_polyedra.AAC.1
MAGERQRFSIDILRARERACCCTRARTRARDISTIGLRVRWRRGIGAMGRAFPTIENKVERE